MKSISELFDEVTPAEADALLHGMETEAADELTEARIRSRVLSAVKSEKHAARSAGPRRLSKAWKRVIASAAAVLLISGAAFGTHAAAEAAEYNTAKSFLSEHHIICDTLTRQEVRDVYKDIRSMSFRLEKTSEVMKDSYAEGYSEERALYDMWFYRGKGDPGRRYDLWGPVQDDGSHYASYGISEASLHPLMPGLSDEVLYNVFVKERMGETIWAYDLEPGESPGYALPVNDGVIIEIIRDHHSEVGNIRKHPVSFIKLDNDGRFVWRSDYEDFPFVMNGTLSAEPDGGFTLMGQGGAVGENCTLLEAYRFSADGRLERTVIAGENELFCFYSPELYARYNDGYAVLIEKTRGTFSPDRPEDPFDEDALILLFDAEGNRAGEIRSGALAVGRGEHEYFTVSAMRGIGGKLYISGTEYRTMPADSFDDRRDPETGLLTEEGAAELAGILRENHTAVLLVYDPADGSVKEITRSKGACGRTVHHDIGGGIVWDLTRPETVKRLTDDPNGLYRPDTLRCDMECRLVQLCMDAQCNISAEIVTDGRMHETFGTEPAYYDDAANE